MSKTLRRRLLWCVLAWFPCFLHAAQIADHTPPGSQDAVVHIEIHGDQPVADVPATLFGSFLEPIGHSTYGGLWAELLENNSLEDGLWSAGNIAEMLKARPELQTSSRLGIPPPWEPLVAAQGNRYEPRWGDAANSSRSLEIMALPEETGIRQRIYLPVHRTRVFEGSLWIKHLSGAAAVSVSIRKRNESDRILADARLDAANPEWTRYTFTLKLKPGDLGHLEPADFVISLSNDGRALVDEISLMPADNVDGMDPDVLELARELKSPIVRFGGNFTSGYHWRDGIGPRDKRVSMLNLAWGIPEYNIFGTDEFLRFCELIGAQPQIALNLGTGTPEEAAGWVKYVNEHWKGQHGGLLWELGNELWGNWNAGYPATAQIGDRTRLFSDAVRKVDPQARLIGTGADPDHFQQWNAIQLANPPGTFDYLSTHFVVTTDSVQLPHPSNDFIAQAAFALPVGLGRQLEKMQEQVQQSPDRDVRIAFTEWLFVGGHEYDGHAAPDFNNMGGAIATGGFLNMLLQHSRIVPISDMTGIMEFAGIWKRREQVFAAPGYWVLRSYAETAPERLLKVESDSPTYAVEHGVTRGPDIPNVPWLDLCAARGHKGDLVLFAVNRSLDHDYRAAITLDGFVPSSSVLVKTISSPSIYDRNDEDNPNAVGVSLSRVPAARVTNYTFPHASVVVLSFQPAAGR